MRLLFSALTIGLLLSAPIHAGDDGLTGRWKFSIFEDGQTIPFWIVQLESKDGKLAASAEPINAPKATVEEAKQVGDTFTLRLRIDQKGQAIHFDYEGKLPKPGAKKILGSLSQGAVVIPVILEATTAKNAYELNRETLLRTPSDPKAFGAIVELIQGAKEHKVEAKDLQEWVDGSLKTAELYGPRFQQKQQMRILTALRGRTEYATIAAEVARKIGKQIDPKGPLDMQLQLLSTVAEALRGANQKDEATALDKRIEKLEGQAYGEYAKQALNYKPVKFAGRKGNSNRAMLVELFTGAQCPPCVAADMAFDGLEKTYGPGEVVLLQYHLHIPRPEPLANADAEARFEFYAEANPKKVRGTPSGLFNGKPDVAGGGPRDEAPEVYKEYCAYINKQLETPATAKLSASATRKDDKIAIVAKVADLDKPGDKVRLRLALVEDWVRFKGGNGMQYHHRVVRAMPGGAKGIALKTKDAEHKASIDLAQLRKSLNDYLDAEYPDGARPMRLRNLHVVVFVQDDATAEVLQAVDVAVKDE
jgi:hypothetical protein